MEKSALFLKSKKKIFVSLFVFVLLSLFVVLFFLYKNAIKKTESLISKIGTVTLQTEDKIIKAENSYKKLSATQKKQVKNANELFSARKSYDNIFYVYDLINRIPDNTGLDVSSLKTAEKAYASLPENEKIYITNHIRLKNLRRKYMCAATNCDEKKPPFWGSYCSKHSCRANLCYSIREENSSYCRSHLCLHPNCYNQNTGGNYCSLHECSNYVCRLPKIHNSNYCVLHK